MAKTSKAKRTRATGAKRNGKQQAKSDRKKVETAASAPGSSQSAEIAELMPQRNERGQFDS